MRKRRKSSRRSETSSWQSYSDIMASILLVTVLVLTGAILVAQKNVEDQKSQLRDQEARLQDQLSMIDIIESQLADEKSALDDTNSKLENILGIKREIIQELSEQFGNNAQLRINEQTGAIMFDSELLFDKDRAELKEAGKDFLRSFLPIYMNVLDSDQFRNMIAEIIIEGHADTRGTYLHNLELSQERALSVVSFFLSDESSLFPKAELERLRKIVTANGRSFSVPVLNADGTENLDLSRRVEIQFRLTDEQMIRDMASAIRGEDTAEP